MTLVLSSKELVFTFTVCYAIGPVQQGIGIYIYSLLCHWSCPARNWYLHLQFAMQLVLYSKELVFTLITVCYAIGPVQQGIVIYIYSLLSIGPVQQGIGIYIYSLLSIGPVQQGIGIDI